MEKIVFRMGLIQVIVLITPDYYTVSIVFCDDVCIRLLIFMLVHYDVLIFMHFLLCHVHSYQLTTYIHLYIIASLIAGGCSFGFSALSLFVMSMCPKLLIQISLLFSLVMSLAMVVVSALYGNIIGAIFGGIFFLISVCYACCVWRRIPFAAANLNTGLTAVKSNSGVILVAYLITIFSFFYSMLWMVALVGVYDKEGLCDTTTNFNGETTTTREE